MNQGGGDESYESFSLRRIFDRGENISNLGSTTRLHMCIRQGQVLTHWYGCRLATYGCTSQDIDTYASQKLKKLAPTKAGLR
jgi:hypothetical protein